MFWLAVGELIEFRGVFKEQVPPDGWARRLGMLSKGELLLAFEWYVYEAPIYPPTLLDFLRWAKKPSSPKVAETLQQYTERMKKEDQQRLEVKPARQSVREQHIKKMKAILR